MYTHINLNLESFLFRPLSLQSMYLLVQIPEVLDEEVPKDAGIARLPPRHRHQQVHL